MRAVALGISFGALIGCAAEGAVELTFELPESGALSPLGDNLTLAEVTLVTEVPGEDPTRAARRVVDTGDGFSLGTVPIADGVSLAVELRSPALRLIGYGRTASPIDITADDVTRVEISLRRPFAYVTGGGGIDTYDAALEPGFPYRDVISMSPTPIAVVGTRSGSELVAVAENELRLVSTASHTPMEFAPVPLSLAPSDVAISPDDATIVVGHAGPSGGISVVHLDDVRGETAAAAFVPLGNVSRVAVGVGAEPGDPPRAYALLDAIAPDGECGSAGASRVEVRSVDSPADPLVTIEPGEPISDFAVHARADAMALAALCSDTVLGVAPRREPDRIVALQDVRGVASVAVLDGRVWSVGSRPSSGNDGAQLVLGAVEFGGGGATLVDLPEAEERALSLEFSKTGQFAEMAMNADELTPLDLAVLPGGDHVAILTRGYYHGEEVIGPILGVPTLIIPEMWLTAWEYMLVDVASATPVQRVRTRCDLDWRHDAYLDEFECTRAPGQDVVADPGFVPAQLSVLNGAR